MADEDYDRPLPQQSWPSNEVVNSALYILDKIRPEIESGHFKEVYRYAQHFYYLVHFGAIAQDRAELSLPITKLD